MSESISASGPHIVLHAHVCPQGSLSGFHRVLMEEIHVADEQYLWSKQECNVIKNLIHIRSLREPTWSRGPQQGPIRSYGP